MWKALVLFAGSVAVAIPATAQISAEDAIGMCRSQVKVDAGNLLGTSRVQFREDGVSRNQGSRYRVDGTFAAGREPGTHTFACSVDRAGGYLRWVRIDSRRVPSRLAGGGIAYTDAEILNICRDAVKSQVFDDGYIGAYFRSMNIESGPGVMGNVSGQVMGQTAGHENLFGYACQIDRSTGEVISVHVNGH